MKTASIGFDKTSELSSNPRNVLSHPVICDKPTRRSSLSKTSVAKFHAHRYLSATAAFRALQSRPVASPRQKRNETKQQKGKKKDVSREDRRIGPTHPGTFGLFSQRDATAAAPCRTGPPDASSPSERKDGQVLGSVVVWQRTRSIPQLGMGTAGGAREENRWKGQMTADFVFHLRRRKGHRWHALGPGAAKNESRVSLADHNLRSRGLRCAAPPPSLLG